jgi:hypothetical protein
LVPGIRKVRPQVVTKTGEKRRAWCYELPTLQHCREAFEEALGQSVVWPTGGESRREADDDEVPV